MEFSGQLPMKVSCQRAIESCHNAENLNLLLPVTGTITRESETHYGLLLTPNTPILRASLPGTMDVTAVVPGAIYDLQSEAKVWGLGAIKMQARLEFEGTGDSCTLTYSGSLESSGLLARVIKPREDQIRDRVEHGFVRLRQQILLDAARSAAAGKA